MANSSYFTFRVIFWFYKVQNASCCPLLMLTNPKLLTYLNKRYIFCDWRSLTAWEKNLLELWQQILLYLLLDGSRLSRLWLGWISLLVLSGLFADISPQQYHWCTLMDANNSPCGFNHLLLCWLANCIFIVMMMTRFTTNESQQSV